MTDCAILHFPPILVKYKKIGDFNGLLTTPLFDEMYTGFGDIGLSLKSVTIKMRCPTKNW